MFEKQKEFQTNFIDFKTCTFPERVAYSKENALALYRELGEALNEIPWKHHRKQDETYDKEALHEELIDCFKFFMNLCIAWDLDETKLFEIFNTKTKIVEDRYKEEYGN